MRKIKPLSDHERSVYEWQMWVPGFDSLAQEKLKASTVLVSRGGGLGGLVAYELAAAGLGRLILCHGGNLKPSDLNRQLLMTEDWLGKPRVECAAKRLHELNPRMEITAVPENISDENAARVIGEADIIVDAAPLFEERFAMNREIVRMRRPMVDCAMYSMEAQITTIIPGKTPCLRCLYPEKPSAWKREFPVIGAVSGTVGCLGALEVIKLISGIGQPLYSQLLSIDLADMEFHKIKIKRNPNCPDCKGI